MAENANLTPKDGEDGGTPEKETPEITPEGQEEKETPKETTAEGLESISEAGEEGAYKKRYADSSREAQRLARENEQLKIQMAELAQQPKIAIETPSDTELAQSVPDWDILSPTEQKLMREQIFLKRKLSALETSQTLTNKQLLWEKDFSELTLKPEFSVLKAKKQEFDHFCLKHPYTSIEVLAQSFLFGEAKTIGAKEEQEKLKRPGLEKGVGGTRTPTFIGITPEEATKLQKENPLLYTKMVKEGKIK